jgi:hypothetical protein
MTVVPFFNSEERALIDEYRLGTPEHRKEILRYLKYLLECAVDEEEIARHNRLLEFLTRDPD